MGIIKEDNCESDDNKDSSLENESSVHSTQYKNSSLSFFATNNLNNQPSFNRVYGYCFANKFESMQIESSLDSISLKFPISHSVHTGHFLDIFDGTSPSHFSSEENKEAKSNSYLKLKFTRYGDKRFLSLDCGVYADIYEYNLSELLNIFVKSDIKNMDGLVSDELVLRVTDKTECLDVDNLSVKFKQLVTHDDLDHDGVDVKKTLESISAFNRNCLKRFEELTCKRDINNYELSLETGLILNRMIDNYKIGSQEQYKKVLNNLDVIEKTDIFRNDPIIRLSLIDIRSSIDMLKKRVLKLGRGVELNEQQLNFILHELGKHEGNKPENDAWFPLGTRDKVVQHLEAFYSTFQYSSESSESFRFNNKVLISS